MMKGYDRSEAAAFIEKSLRRNMPEGLPLPLEELVSLMIDGDEAYMRRAGIVDQEGNVNSRVFYEDDEAFEAILSYVVKACPRQPAAAAALASLVDDYMDSQQAYLESRGLMDWA